MEGKNRSPGMPRPSGIRPPSATPKSQSPKSSRKLIDQARLEATLKNLAESPPKSVTKSVKNMFSPRSTPPSSPTSLAASPPTASRLAFTDAMKDETMLEISKALNQITTEDGSDIIHIQTLIKIGNDAARKKAPATKSVMVRVADSLLKASSAQTETHFGIVEVAREIRRRIPHDAADRKRLVDNLKEGHRFIGSPSGTTQQQADSAPQLSSLAKYTREAGGISLEDKVAAESAEIAAAKAAAESVEKAANPVAAIAEPASVVEEDRTDGRLWYKGVLLEDGVAPPTESKVQPTAAKSSSGGGTTSPPKRVVVLCSQPIMMLTVVAGVCLAALGVGYNLKKQGKIPKSWPWSL